MMPDPMGEPDGGGGNASAADGQHNTNEKEFFDPLVLQFNIAKLERIQSVLGIAAGCITGICGLTGIRGFVCFLLWHFSTCWLICAVKMKFQLKTYTRQTWFHYLTSTLQQNGLSFTLFWTLFYGLVYLY